MDFENIYLTGDKHAQFNELMRNALKYHFSNNDLIIILGDVGINYYNSTRDDLSKRILSDIPGVFLCIHGNHELRPTSTKIAKKYEKIKWQGDTAYVEKKFPKLIMAEDGSRYKINGREFLIIGGAYSVDKEYRLSHNLNWFEDEQLNDEEKDTIIQKINEHGNKEDIILAHTCPLKAIPTETFLPGIKQETVDQSTEIFLQKVADTADFNEFYCGHYHIDKNAGPIHFLYEGIIKL